VHIKAIDLSTIVGDQLTGNGSATAFTLSRSIDDENNTFVFINGVYQDKSTYSISGTTLTFSTAPQNGYTIEVMSFDSISIASTGVTTVNDLSGGLTIAAGNGISISKNTSTKTLTIANTLIDTTVSYNTPTGQSLTYTTPSQSTGQAGSVYGPQTFTITGGAATVLSGTASISGLPNGVTISSQSYNNTNPGNILTITLGGVFPSANSLNTNLTISGLTAALIISVDYLVVAGGGGGGGSTSANTQGGGGGAGGLRTSYGSASGGGSSVESALSLTSSTNYTVTVGAGGSGGTTGLGGDGNNSVFHTITATGGGGGGYTSNDGRPGGSGGGGSFNSNGGTASSPTQGYRGGNVVDGYGGNFPVDYKTGGGGGAAATGQDGTFSTGQGNGGAGLAVNILSTSNATTYSVGEVSSSNVYFSGGGAGGSGTGSGAPTGGIGGGANNGNGYHGVGDPGTANTGGGGSSGNGAIPSTGGAGGSGAVIIRHTSAVNLSIGSGLTGSTFTEGSDKVSVFTAGSGTISFS